MIDISLLVELGDFVGQADGLDGAVFTFFPLCDGGWNVVAGGELMGLGNGRFCHRVQVVIKGNRESFSGTPVEDFAMRNSLAGHLFQADRLGAKLDIVIVPFALLAVFVFNGDVRTAV